MADTEGDAADMQRISAMCARYNEQMKQAVQAYAAARLLDFPGGSVAMEDLRRDMHRWLATERPAWLDDDFGAPFARDLCRCLGGYAEHLRDVVLRTQPPVIAAAQRRLRTVHFKGEDLAAVRARTLRQVYCRYVQAREGAFMPLDAFVARMWSWHWDCHHVERFRMAYRMTEAYLQAHTGVAPTFRDGIRGFEGYELRELSGDMGAFPTHV